MQYFKEPTLNQVKAAEGQLKVALMQSVASAQNGNATQLG
jgi:hypothetical protein